MTKKPKKALSTQERHDLALIKLIAPKLASEFCKKLRVIVRDNMEHTRAEKLLSVNACFSYVLRKNPDRIHWDILIKDLTIASRTATVHEVQNVE